MAEQLSTMKVDPKGSGQEFDIIVPSHGGLDLITKCMRVLLAHTRTPFHLIIVDDSDPEKDWTLKYLQSQVGHYKNFTLVHSETPYKSGNQIFNAGLANCRNEFVATVMNSVMVEPDWELVALKLMNEHPKVGTMGLKSLFPEGCIESAGIKIVNCLPQDIGHGEAGHRLSSVFSCDAVQWAFAIHRKEAIMNLEEDHYRGFRGWDDIDNSLVVRRRGWDIMYCGLGAGYHFPRATRGDDSEQAKKENLENREIFWKRWGLWTEAKAKVMVPITELLPDIAECKFDREIAQRVEAKLNV